jgi:hypothetical protein
MSVVFMMEQNHSDCPAWWAPPRIRSGRPGKTPTKIKPSAVHEDSKTLFTSTIQKYTESIKRPNTKPAFSIVNSRARDVGRNIIGYIESVILMTIRYE